MLTKQCCNHNRVSPETVVRDRMDVVDRRECRLIDARWRVIQLEEQWVARELSGREVR
jgi:hypothetical protein